MKIEIELTREEAETFLIILADVYVAVGTISPSCTPALSKVGDAIAHALIDNKRENTTFIRN